MSKIELIADFEDIELAKGGTQANLIFKLRKKDFYLYDKLKAMNNEKGIDLVISKHRDKRSTDANNYAWCLQSEIAKVLNKPLDELHKELIMQYGVIEVYSIKKVAVQSAIRMFDYYEILGESKAKDTEFVHIKAGVGTHKYNTKEMSQFIDGVVQVAKELDIETKTPNEIAELKNLWGVE